SRARRAVVEWVRVEDTGAAANDGPLPSEGAPRKTETRCDVVPVSLVWKLRPAIGPGEPHHSRRAGDGIDRDRVKAIHPVVLVFDRRVRFPPEADVQSEVLADGPVVLDERSQIPARSVEHVRFANRYAVWKSHKQAGESVTGAGASGQARRLRGEVEVSRN